MQKLDQFQDAFFRAVLIEQVSKTSKYSKKLEKYIMIGMTQKQILESVFRDQIVSEGVLDTDIEKEQAIAKLEPILHIVSSLGFAWLFGTRIKKNIEKVIPNWMQASIDPETKLHRLGMVTGGAVTFLSGGIGKLVSKIITILLARTFLVCNRSCERFAPQQVVNRELMVRICTKKCRISGIQKVLQKLHHDAMMCDTTKNPWKCKSTLYSRIGELQDKLQEEEKQLKKFYEIMNSKVPDIRKQPKM